MALSNSDQEQIDEVISNDARQMEQEETAIQTEQPKELGTLSKEYFRQNLNVGLEEMTPDDLPTPTITLVTASSKMRDEEGRPYIPGLFYYKGLKKTYKELDITMLGYTKAMMPSYDDKEILEKNYVFFGVIEEEGEMLPFKWYLKKTGAGSAKRLLGDVKAARMPMFALKIHATAEAKSGEKFDYHIINFSIKGIHQDPEKVVILENLAKNYSPKMAEEALKIDEEERPSNYGNPDIPF